MQVKALAEPGIKFLVSGRVQMDEAQASAASSSDPANLSLALDGEVNFGQAKAEDNKIQNFEPLRILHADAAFADVDSGAAQRRLLKPGDLDREIHGVAEVAAMLAQHESLGGAQDAGEEVGRNGFFQDEVRAHINGLMQIGAAVEDCHQDGIAIGGDFADAGHKILAADGVVTIHDNGFEAAGAQTIFGVGALSANLALDASAIQFRAKHAQRLQFVAEDEGGKWHFDNDARARDGWATSYARNPLRSPAVLRCLATSADFHRCAVLLRCVKIFEEGRAADQIAEMLLFSYPHPSPLPVFGFDGVRPHSRAKI